MSLEGQLLDQKSLRSVTGKTANWNEIAKDCISFANATGGRLLLGIVMTVDADLNGIRKVRTKFDEQRAEVFVQQVEVVMVR